MNMISFDKLFTENHPAEYNGKIIHRIHFFPVKDGDILLASIESTNSDCRQGFCIDITGWCEMGGDKHKVGKGIRMLFWEDTAPKRIELKIHPSNDRVVIYNICEKITRNVIDSDCDGKPQIREATYIDSKNFGAAMIVEEIQNGFRYRCNDWHPDDNFDDIIFTVQKLPKA